MCVCVACLPHYKEYVTLISVISPMSQLAQTVTGVHRETELRTPLEWGNLGDFRKDELSLKRWRDINKTSKQHVPRPGSLEHLRGGHLVRVGRARRGWW